MKKLLTKKYSREHAIIFAVVVLLIASFCFLAHVEQKQATPDGWWAVYFSQPHDGNVNFVIENYADTEEFTYTITREQDVVREGKINVASNSSEAVILGLKNSQNKKLTITVNRGKEKKTLTKMVRAQE